MGLLTTPSKLTSQSSAFFITPEMPWAYSGLAIRRASAWRIAERNIRTGPGGLSSRSGLKSERSPRPENTVTVIDGGARRATTRQKAELIERARRLPESASRFMPPNALAERALHTATRRALYRDRCAPATC